MSISRNFFHVSTEIWALSLFLSLSSYLSSLSVHLFVYLSIYCVRYTTLIQSTTVIIIPSMQLFFAYLPMPLILSVTVYPIIYLTFFLLHMPVFAFIYLRTFVSLLLYLIFCVHVYATHTNLHTETYIDIHTLHLCVSVRVFVQIYIFMHTHIHGNIHIDPFLCACKSVHTS